MHIHYYTKWGLPQKAYNGSVKQARVCKVCGKIQVRDMGYLDGLGADGVAKSLDENLKYITEEAVLKSN